MNNNCAMGKNWLLIIVVLLVIIYFCGNNSNTLFGSLGCGEQCGC